MDNEWETVFVDSFAAAFFFFIFAPKQASFNCKSYSVC